MKPIVQYIDLGFCVLGCPADVKPYDHPRRELNQVWVRTTNVLAMYWTPDGPAFETRNTRYVPCPTEPEPVQEWTREPAKLS